MILTGDNGVITISLKRLRGIWYKPWTWSYMYKQEAFKVEQFKVQISNIKGKDDRLREASVDLICRECDNTR